MKTKDIPIKNIYYMLMYAWDRAKEIENINVSKLQGDNLYELLALVLCRSISRIIKKGIYKEYKLNYEEASSLKGKINFDDSLKRNSFRNGRAYCEFDEFSEDVYINQIIKATLYNLLKSRDISKIIKIDIMKVYHYFNHISLIKLNKSIFISTKIHKNNIHYKLSIDICKLIYENMIIDEKDQQITFKKFHTDDREMAYIFENFVRNFYKRNLCGYSVVREDISWNVDEDIFKLLPKMQTDITVKNKEKVIIMDTKYYRKTLSQNMNSNKIHSNNLYQIFSYIKNAEAKGGMYLNSTGILLYPRVDNDLSLRYNIQNHQLKICTVNLNEDWQSIHERLLEIIAY